MTAFWSSWWAFAFMLAPFIVALSGVVIGVYIACTRHFDIMLSAFSKSTWARQQYLLGTTNLASRCYLVSTLSGTLLFPKYLVRKGVIDADDVSNVPHSLRRLMLVSAWLVIIGMAWLFLMVGLLKLTES